MLDGDGAVDEEKINFAGFQKCEQVDFLWADVSAILGEQFGGEGGVFIVLFHELCQEYCSVAARVTVWVGSAEFKHLPCLRCWEGKSKKHSGEVQSELQEIHNSWLKPWQYAPGVDQG